MTWILIPFFAISSSIGRNAGQEEVRTYINEGTNIYIVIYSFVVQTQEATAILHGVIELAIPKPQSNWK